MVWVLALPGLLLSLVPVMVGFGFFFGLARTMWAIFKHMRGYFETRYEPQVIHLEMSDDEIKRRYRDMDNKEKGYNPLRHDYAMIELFPKKPVIEEIRAAAKILFPYRHHQLMPDRKKNEYQTAHGVLLNMLVERHHQVTSKRWSAEKEKLWLEVPYLPKAMQQIDDEYVSWCFLALGKEEKELHAS